MHGWWIYDNLVEFEVMHTTITSNDPEDLELYNHALGQLWTAAVTGAELGHLLDDLAWAHSQQPEKGSSFTVLLANNSKAYYEDNKQICLEQVRAPMEALLAELEGEFGEFGTGKVFRPYRDPRFAKDKTPYKTHCGAVLERGRGGGRCTCPRKGCWWVRAVSTPNRTSSPGCAPRSTRTGAARSCST